MKTRSYVVALALLLAPLTGTEAQTPDAPIRGQMRARPGNPVALLLERRDSLSLTANQVARLVTIQADLEEENAPLLSQIGEFPGRGALPGRENARGGTRPDSAAIEEMRQRRAEVETLMEEVRLNTQAALEVALAVLTAEQREEAASILARRGGGAFGRGGPGRPGGAGAPGDPRPPRGDRPAV